MDEFLDTIHDIDISRERRKSISARCVLTEIRSLQSLAGKLNYLGHGVLPPAAYLASKLQKFVGDLRVDHLRQANVGLKTIKRLHPRFLLVAPDAPLPTLRNVGLSTFSDAGIGKTPCGQTGFLTGPLLPTGGGAHIYHPLDWHSSKQCRVSFSSIGSEILAAAESADRSLHIRECLSLILPSTRVPLALTVDSYGLYYTITTLHEGRIIVSAPRWLVFAIHSRPRRSTPYTGYPDPTT